MTPMEKAYEASTPEQRKQWLENSLRSLQDAEEKSKALTVRLIALNATLEAFLEDDDGIMELPRRLREMTSSLIGGGRSIAATVLHFSNEALYQESRRQKEREGF